MSLGFAKSDTINNRSMVKSIRNNSIFVGEDSLKETSISIKTTGEEDGIFMSMELGNLCFQIFMEILGSANKSNRTHTKTMGLESISGSVDDLLIIGEAKIIIGTEIEDLLSIRDNLHFLGR